MREARVRVCLMGGWMTGRRGLRSVDVSLLARNIYNADATTTVKYIYMSAAQAIIVEGTPNRVLTVYPRVPYTKGFHLTTHTPYPASETYTPTRPPADNPLPPSSRHRRLPHPVYHRRRRRRRRRPTCS